MIFFPNAQTFLQVGDYSISWSGILTIVGIYLVYMLSRKILKKEGSSNTMTEDLFIGSLFFGIAASRLFYCLQNLEFYSQHPLQILNLGDGGSAGMFGWIVGLLFVILYCRANHLSILRASDAILPNVFLGWGIASIQFEQKKMAEERLVAYLIQGITLETVLLFVGFILISVVYRSVKKRRRGSLTYVSLIGIGGSFLLHPQNLISVFLNFLLIGIGLAGYLGFIEKAMKKQKPVLLFDLDGTLLDTQPAIFYSFKKLFEHYAPETEVTDEVLNSVIGPPLETSIKKYFPKEDQDALVKEYRSHNREAHKTLVQPMEGCRELLQDLKERGYRMAIVSAKRKDMVELGCRQCGILDYFELILGSEEVKKHKPDPQGLFEACRLMKASKDNAVYIGDSSTDIEAARRAGMYSIGYIFNPDRKQKLLDSKPNAYVEHLLEIKEILKEDHAWTIDLM